MVYLDNIVTSVFQIHIECDTETTYCFSKSGSAYAETLYEENTTAEKVEVSHDRLNVCRHKPKKKRAALSGEDDRDLLIPLRRSLLSLLWFCVA